MFCMLKKRNYHNFMWKTLNVCRLKDNKNQDKNNDNCNYFTVDFTILNLGIVDTSCNTKERYIKYNFIHMVFK